MVSDSKYLVVAIATLVLKLTLCTASSWSYDNVNEWGVDFPLCGGDTQSPIDIDYDKVDTNCPTTLESGRGALLWSAANFQGTYTIENNGHSMKMTATAPFYKNEDIEPIAVLRNNFRTASEEHSYFCLDSVHFHFGSNDGQGSEHTVNGKSAPLEMHFVHYSCDYHSLADALADENVEDPYVLAVVGVMFEVGEENAYFEHIVNKIAYDVDAGSSMVIANAPFIDLVPLATTDYFYYEGSLTTPGCNPIVRWHLLTETLSISKKQLDMLRLLQNDDGESLADNFRPVQQNQNTLHYCSPEYDFPNSFSDNIFELKGRHTPRTRDTY